MTALLVSSEQVAGLIRHPVIRAVTLTGSDRPGEAVASEAGKQLKKTVLELGGSDPFLVLADADPVEAARQASRARTINTGQSCIAAKRFIVEEPIAEPFELAFTRQMAGLAVGDPLDRANALGPLAREDLLESFHDQVRRTVAAGAELRTGGRRLPRRGFFYAPTVLAGVEPGMPAFEGETFGPVAAVIRARNTEHAVELANHCRFGLGASIWTANPRRGEELAAALEAGVVFVNEMVRSDPRLPFGGIKRSGHGRSWPRSASASSSTSRPCGSSRGGAARLWGAPTCACTDRSEQERRWANPTTSGAEVSRLPRCGGTGSGGLTPTCPTSGRTFWVRRRRPSTSWSSWLTPPQHAVLLRAGEDHPEGLHQDTGPTPASGGDLQGGPSNRLHEVSVEPRPLRPTALVLAAYPQADTACNDPVPGD
jgi:hypothetical protein